MPTFKFFVAKYHKRRYIDGGLTKTNMLLFFVTRTF